MSKDRLKHSLDELFSDFSPPTPEGEAEPSNLAPRSGVRAVADTPQELAPPQNDAPPERRPPVVAAVRRRGPPHDAVASTGRRLREDAPRQRGPYETRPLLEKEPLSGQKEDINKEEDVAEDEKIGQEDNSSPEDNIRTWRAGWRNLASENTNGKGRTGSVKGPIGIRRRKLADGRHKSGEREL